MAEKMSVSEALALLDRIGREVATTDADLIQKLAEQLSDAEFKLPASVEVATRLLELAGTRGIAERLQTRCVLLMPTVEPSFTDALAALLTRSRPFAASFALEKLSELGTLEAGRAAGARLPEFQEIRLRALTSDAFVAGLTEGIGEQPLSALVALAVASALETGFDRHELSAEVPARLGESLAAALLTSATALSSVPHRFPTGFWSQGEHGPQALDLAQGARSLARLTTTPALAKLAEALYQLEDPFLLEAAVYLDLASGRTPPAGAIEKIASFPHTRFTLYQNLDRLKRSELFPPGARGWMALAEGRIVDYLALEDGCIYDVVEGTVQVRIETPRGPRIALAIRCAQSIGESRAIGYLSGVRPDATRPMAETTVGMFGGGESEDEIRASLEQMAASAG
jgi:hypothetical protein